jgi:VIT1/CCC1 family predicted Fe2+/Mn2+ transporter
MSGPDASLARLVSELMQDVGRLLRQELRLAQAEISEKASQARSGLYAVIAGLFLAFCALLVLVLAIVLALGEVMPLWLAAALVGLVLAAVAAILLILGRDNLKARNLLVARGDDDTRYDGKEIQ